MPGTNNAAAESEDRPVSDDDAGLRQRIESQRTGDREGDLAEPKRQRRAEIAAQYIFVADGEQHRHVSRRRAEKNRRNERPQRGLCERHGPEHHGGASAQKLNEQRDVMHWPGAG